MNIYILVVLCLHLIPAIWVIVAASHDTSDKSSRLFNYNMLVGGIITFILTIIAVICQAQAMGGQP